MAKKQTKISKQPEVELVQRKVNSLRIQRWVIFAFALLLYCNTLDHDYTLDDTLMITDNQFTKQGVKGIDDILFNDSFTGFFGDKKNLLPGGRYRPLSQIMFALEYEVFGLKPFPQHLINVLLYAFVCLFVFHVLRKLFKEKQSEKWYLSLPFLAALIFTIHPLHTEVVANIKGRDEIFSLFFNFWMILLAIKFVETRKIHFLLLIAVAFLLGILSKENTITFFAVVPITLFVFSKAKFSDYLLVILFMLLGLGVYFIFRYEALGFILGHSVKNPELLNDPFLEVEKLGMSKLATLFYTYFIYLKLMIFPHPLTHDYYPYHIALTNWSNPVSIISLVIYLGLIAFAAIKIWKKNIVAYGVVFYLAVFSIASNIAVNIGAFMNERFIFIAIMGFAIILAWLLSKKLKELIKDVKKYQTIATIILAVIVIGFSVKTIVRNSAWKNDFTLFTTDAKISKNSAKVTTSAGGKLIEKAKETTNPVERNNYLQQALYYLDHALKIHPKYVAAWVLYGNAFIETENYQSSRTCYENALRLSNGNNADALNNLLYIAQKSAQEKQYRTSINCYFSLLDFKNEKPEYYYGLGSAYLDLNKVDSSIFYLNMAIKTDSSHAISWSKLGEVYGKYLNRIDDAQRYLLKAYELDPEYLSTLENLGIVYGMKGDFKTSLEYLFRALEKEPENTRILSNIASTYNMKKDYKTAVEYFQKALEIEPDNPMFLKLIVDTYILLGDTKNAEEYARKIKG